MSKLYDQYLFLKSTESNSENTLFLFKSGIFFIFLDNDAKIASKLFNLKLTCFVNDIVKCGFPINSLNKYINLIKQTPYNLNIVDPSSSQKYSISDYHVNQNIENLLTEISRIDTESLSIKEAYEFIDNVKLQSKNIIGSIENGK